MVVTLRLDDLVMSARGPNYVGAAGIIALNLYPEGTREEGRGGCWYGHEGGGGHGGGGCWYGHEGGGGHGGGGAGTDTRGSAADDPRRYAELHPVIVPGGGHVAPP